MIQKTVYFRTQTDLDKFNALTNKAQWLHDNLNGKAFSKTVMGNLGTPQPKIDVLTEKKVRSFSEKASDPELGETLEIPKISNLRAINGVCKIHGTPLTEDGKCLQKGCKYS